MKVGASDGGVLSTPSNLVKPSASAAAGRDQHADGSAPFSAPRHQNRDDGERSRRGGLARRQPPGATYVPGACTMMPLHSRPMSVHEEAMRRDCVAHGLGHGGEHAAPARQRRDETNAARQSRRAPSATGHGVPRATTTVKVKKKFAPSPERSRSDISRARP